MSSNPPPTIRTTRSLVFWVVLAVTPLSPAVLGCEKTREAIHEISRAPDAGSTAAATAAPTPAIADAAATTTIASAKVGDASVDASKAASAGKAATPPSSSKPKTPQAPLNGLAAGSICIQGSQGNGGCASGSECTNGKCTCLNGWTSCGGACRDLSRDPYNCDKCGRECAWGEYCKWGNCER